MSIHIEAKQISAAYLNSERSLLRVLLEIDRDRKFEELGYTFLTPYCIKELGLSEDIAKCLVRVVRKSREVPELAEAVIQEEVSLYKARAIVSVITPENKDEWLKKAKILPKDKLIREVSQSRNVDTQRMVFDFPFATVDLLKRAQELVSSKKGSFALDTDVIHEALREYVDRHDPIAKAERESVWGHSATHEVVRNYQEQCQWVYDDGSICGEKKWIHYHHIKPKSEGGGDEAENLIPLCASHHQLYHRDYHKPGIH